MQQHIKVSSGFTLIELLVVISIIGILAGIVLASLGSARDGAKIARAQGELKSIENAFNIALLATTNNFLNANIGVIGENIWYVPNCTGPVNVSGDDRPNGQYVDQFSTALASAMNSIPLDPWGGRYWVDGGYQCTAGERAAVEGQCTVGDGSWYFVIGSGGPNNSAPNIYDGDNVVRILCKHG